MGVVPDNVIDAMRQSHALGIFLRIDTDPALHVWFGVEEKTARFDSIDPEGATYLGGGYLIGIPTLEMLVNGQSDSIDFTLSGIDPTTAAKTMDSIPPVRGVAVQLGLMVLDDYYQPMGPIVAIWNGTASHTAEIGQASENGDMSITISLSVVAGSVTRSRAAKTLWTDAQQKLVSSTDDFCRQVQRLANGLAVVWPNY
ncbi:hypothetical protein G6M87_09260 [Rhizobium rhizogenes]|uniref:hypothetical protein n=1 Tax=Rhizobium rhizogenes TaxID=359 RepID=UPI001571C7BD|nr:hypothetical protein [Rhizobium rhizogenes]NTI22050.1 hypothetical protein [Rhizobium rhizogenes]QTG05653.1 hypothetical protein G6M87_09260 [Rhizobium rhizogenes]